MQEGDCGKRDAGRGLWEKGMQEGDCGKRDAKRGMRKPGIDYKG